MHEACLFPGMPSCRVATQPACQPSYRAFRKRLVQNPRMWQKITILLHHVMIDT